MAKDTPYVALLQAAYRLWSDSKGNSADQWIGICAEQIKFGSLAQEPKGAAYFTEYQSRENLVAYFAGLKRDWDMIEFVAENFVAQDDRVIMLGRCSWRFKATGKVVSTPKVDSWRFAGGKAVKFYEYFDTAQLRDAVV